MIQTSLEALDGTTRPSARNGKRSVYHPINTMLSIGGGYPKQTRSLAAKGSPIHPKHQSVPTHLSGDSWLNLDGLPKLTESLSGESRSSFLMLSGIAARLPCANYANW